MLTLLVSIPSVGLLLSAHLMVVTDGFMRKVSARQLAAYIGICPYEHKIRDKQPYRESYRSVNPNLVMAA